MLSSEIERVRIALGELAGKINEDEWAFICCCRRDLEGARNYAEGLEANPVPFDEPETKPQVQ